MNVAQFLHSVIRRPIALTLIAIFAGVACYHGLASASTLYQSTAVAVVIPPGSGSPDAGLNPLINLNNNTAQLTAIVATALQSDGGHQAARDAGGTGNFTVNTTYGDAAMYAQLSSQLVIVAEAPDPNSARAAAAALVNYARDCLNKIQYDSAVPVVNNALLIPSVEPSQPVKLPTGGVRSAAAYALATVLAGLALLLLFDVARESIRRVRRQSSHKASTPAESRTHAFEQVQISDLDGALRSETHA